ncbi:MAG: prolyl oligopeptidase family serine peptidase [Phycisphaerales bacterium]
MPHPTCRVLLACACLLPAATALADLTLAKDAHSLALSEGLAIDGVSEWARRPINIDGVVGAMVDGALGDPAKNPKAGDTIPVPPALVEEGGPTTAAWHEVKGEVKGEGVQASGVFGEMPRGTYVLFAVQSERERVMMLEASGHGVAYVNGEPRVGDPYSFGFVRLPILLHAGANQIILQHANRGEMRARLEEPKGEVEINEKDLTLPDVTGTGDYRFAVPIVNATTRPLRVIVRASGLGAKGPVQESLLALAPLSILKVPLSADIAPTPPVFTSVRVEVMDEERWNNDSAPTPNVSSDLAFATVDERTTHKLTYASAIDGSVQYVSVVPPIPGGDSTARPGLVVSVHGASVEATNQAASYAAKGGLVIACPTNRRPYGFDWEDWGRIDALEAMDFVAREFKTDPRRQYLTGHSMGGHGTWQLGCLYPERFAAIAPSAGWLSFSTYMGALGQKFGPGGDDPVMQKFREVIAPSDTVPLLARLKGTGIYILHGDADDNVPVTEARRAREELTKLNIPFEFHEQPGAGHWWDDDGIKKANAGPDGSVKWGAACVDWPDIFGMFASRTLPEKPGPAARASPLGPDGFHPGSFKRAFNNHFVLVYGTHGTPEENAWAYAKARFDGEQWWYRGNGYARVMSDDAYAAGPADQGGNLVLYGARSMNSAWNTAHLAEQTAESREKLRARAGSDAAWLMTKPMPGAGARLVGAVCGTTLRSMRATDRLSYFSAGVDYPCATVLSPDVWTRGEPAVLGAGLSTGPGPIDADQLQWR